MEKCGKVLTCSQMLYICRQFWHEKCQLKTSRFLFDAEFIYHIRLQRSRKNDRLTDGFARDASMQGVRQLRRNREGPLPAQPDGAKVAAGRLMLSRIKTLIADKADFAIETTLAAKSYHALIKKAREEGYKASLIYFWLQSPELAIKRVAERVKHGGHHVDDSIIRRRYRAGIKNLFNLYCPVVDYFLFIDNSIMPSEVIAEGNIKSIKFYNEEKFKKIRQYDNSNSECKEE